MYKASYRVTAVAQGQTITLDQTWYSKPPKARYDYSFGGGSFSTFVLEDGTFFCTIISGGTASCSKSDAPAAGQNQGALFDTQLRERPDQFSGSFTGTRTIAGQQAQCFAVKPTAGSAFSDVMVCYNAAGIPLLLQMKGQGLEWSMEATGLSSDVSDADFKLPGPVR